MNNHRVFQWPERAGPAKAFLALAVMVLGGIALGAAPQLAQADSRVAVAGVSITPTGNITIVRELDFGLIFAPESYSNYFLVEALRDPAWLPNDPGTDSMGTMSASDSSLALGGHHTGLIDVEVAEGVEYAVTVETDGCRLNDGPMAYNSLYMQLEFINSEIPLSGLRGTYSNVEIGGKLSINPAANHPDLIGKWVCDYNITIEYSF